MACVPGNEQMQNKTFVYQLQVCRFGVCLSMYEEGGVLGCVHGDDTLKTSCLVYIVYLSMDGW